MKNIIYLSGRQALFLLLAILATAAACNKDDGPDNPWGLPDATQIGANTFGCLIDGEPWVAEVTTFGTLQKITATYDEIGSGVADQFYLNVSANFLTSTLDSAKKEKFTLNLRPIYNEDDLDFSQLLRKDIAYYSRLLNIDNSLKLYSLDTLHDNNLTITNLDTVNNICSAEFSFQLIRASYSDTLKVTEGRFDVKYQPD